MYLRHFGLKYAPLGKECQTLFESDQLKNLVKKFHWLLESPGVGVLTAEPGLGKTAILRQVTKQLNPHEYRVIYVSETDFSRLEFYRQLAVAFGLMPRYRRTQQWKELKDRITDLMDNKHILPVLIIDEAQNLSHEFWCDFPSFLNFSFDSRDMMTVWFVGHPQLNRILSRVPYEALQGRIHVRHQLQPINNKEQFTALIQHGLSDAGCQQTLLSNSGIELIRVASQGKPRLAHSLLTAALRDAADQNMNHLSDEIIEQAIRMLQGS